MSSEQNERIQQVGKNHWYISALLIKKHNNFGKAHKYPGFLRRGDGLIQIDFRLAYSNPA